MNRRKRPAVSDESASAKNAWYVCKPGSVGDDRSHPCPLSIWDDCCQHASSHLRRAAGPTVYPKVQDAYGVAPDRVYICTQLPAMPVSFYLAFPSVPKDPKISQSPLGALEAIKTSVGYFCCTFPGVSSGGRYPLSCPAGPGLSSCQYLSAT